MLFALAALYGNIYIYKTRKRIDDTGLGSYMEACSLWMLFLFVLTETLSAGHAMRFRFLFMAWGAFDALLLLFFVVQCRWSDIHLRDMWRGHLAAWSIRGVLGYGILFVIGGVVCCLSFITTPYNWDSMTYHLPRIAYWAQNRSVAHYATNCIRQVSSPVLAEFVNLHVYILCRGHDLLFNLLQGTSYITCAVLVGGIAEKLSCSRPLRWLTMLLYMTMPIAFAEALTTQVDNFAAIWLLFFVYRLLDYVDPEIPMRFEVVTVSRICFMGLCTAWGYLAKPSVCVGMVIFALWLLLVCIKRRDRVRELAGIFFSALPCVVLPLLPEILRNFKTFGAYASPTAGAAQLVGTLKPNYLFVNFLKNLSFNMPTIFVKNAEAYFAKIAVKAAELLKVELDAVSISENGGAYSLHEAGSYGCDTAVNAIVLWLFLFCVLWTLLSLGRNRWEKKERGYFLAASFSFAVFCTVLRWEPYVSRYMISYLALLCPMITAGIQRGMKKEWGRMPCRGIIGLVGVLCVLQAFALTRYHYDIWKGPARNRPYGYFTARWDEVAVYASLTDEIKSRGYDKVGLRLLKADDFEYPLWEMLEDCRLEHVQVKNKTAGYADVDFVPDCIIWFGELPGESVQIGDMSYNKITEFGSKQYLLEN